MRHVSLATSAGQSIPLSLLTTPERLRLKGELLYEAELLSLEAMDEEDEWGLLLARIGRFERKDQEEHP